MEIDEHLKKFVVAAPPPELKARALAAASRRPVWPVLAAVTLALAVLWALNYQAEASLRSALVRGASVHRVEDQGDTQLGLLALLRKEMQ